MVAVGELMLDGSDDGEVIISIQCMGMGRAGHRMGAGLARGAGRVASVHQPSHVRHRAHGHVTWSGREDFTRTYLI